MNTAHLLFLTYVLASGPLVWQDLKTLSVSQWLLGIVFTAWVLLGWWAGDVPAKAALSAGVLTLGAVLIVLLPDRLGEADVVYIAGLAWLMPFWNLVLTVALACVMAMVVLGVRAWRGQGDLGVLLAPFLPSLALAAMVMWWQ